MGLQKIHEHEALGGGSGRRLYCWLTSLSRSLQTILRINLDGTAINRRFYALIRDDLTLSKYDGGKWALENMDSNYNDVIKNAMEDYLSDTNNSYDNTRLKEFAGEAISLINDCVNTNKIRK